MAFALVLTGLKYFCYFVIQSRIRSKTDRNSQRSVTFPHASRQLHVFALSFDWFSGFSVTAFCDWPVCYTLVLV